jgi:hypothetical protein
LREASVSEIEADAISGGLAFAGFAAGCSVSD